MDHDPVFDGFARWDLRVLALFFYQIFLIASFSRVSGSLLDKKSCVCYQLILLCECRNLGEVGGVTCEPIRSQGKK